ncbi:protoheme IX farnesyltransferase 2 domain protein, partial [Vibrio parahaemolyticus 10296]
IRTGEPDVVFNNLGWRGAGDCFRLCGEQYF